jgi:hypothetical protein
MSESQTQNKLRIGIPVECTGDAILGFYEKLGIKFSVLAGKVSSTDSEISPRLLHSQEIPEYVAKSEIDCGFSGEDWIKEYQSRGQGDRGNDSDLRIVTRMESELLGFPATCWVLAVPKDSTIREINDLRGCIPAPRISTAIHNFVSEHYTSKGIIIKTLFSWGAIGLHEQFTMKPTREVVEDEDIEDEDNSDGSRFFPDSFVIPCNDMLLSRGLLRNVEIVLKSQTVFFSNNDYYTRNTWGKEKIDEVAMLCCARMNALGNELLRCTARETDSQVLDDLFRGRSIRVNKFPPCDGKVVYEIVCDRLVSRDLIPTLYGKGCDISMTPVDMVY